MREQETLEARLRIARRIILENRTRAKHARMAKMRAQLPTETEEEKRRKRLANTTLPPLSL